MALIRFGSVSDIVAECKFLYGATADILTSNWELWIDAVVKDICARTWLYTKSDNITLVGGTVSYAYPTGALKIRALLYDYDSTSGAVPGTGDAPEFRLIEQIDPTLSRVRTMGDKSLPLYWYVHKEYIYVLPAIITASLPTNKTIEVQHAAVHPDIDADQQTILLPTSVHYMIIPGVMYHALSSKAELGTRREEALAFRDDYEAKIKQVSDLGETFVGRGVPSGESEGGAA